jgi:hypothetical protein
MKYALREKDTEDVLVRSSELDSIYSEPKSHFSSKKYNSRGGLEWDKTFG